MSAPKCTCQDDRGKVNDQDGVGTRVGLVPTNSNVHTL